MTTKEKKLYVLIVEDLPSDAELAKREVNKVLANATFKVVDTEENYIQALNTFKPDVIISDYKMPAFDGMTALKIRQKKLPMTPFIIFTGSMNETIAVECMKAGADDYVIKEHVKRLGQAVLSALEKKKIENEHNRAEQTIINQNEYLNNVFESISQPFYIIDAVDHTVKMANSAAGFNPKIENETCHYVTHNNDKPCKDLVHPCPLEIVRKTKKPTKVEHIHYDKNGKKLYVDVFGYPIFDEKGNVVQMIESILDNTKRKQAEILEKILLKISAEARSTGDLSNLYKAIHAHLSEVLDTTNLFFAIINEDGTEMSFPYYVDEEDLPPDPIKLPQKLISEYVIKTKKPLFLKRQDIIDLANKGLINLDVSGTISEVWMGAPLISQGKAIGIIVLQSYHDPNLYSESDLDILTFVSEQIAQTIEYRQAITDLQVEKTYLDELFTSSPEALALVSIDSTVLHINKQFTSLFGYSEEDAFGRNIDDLLVPSERRKNAEKYTRDVATGTRLDFETVRMKKDGTMINVSVLGSPVNYKGDILAVYVIYRDITDRIKAAEKLKKSEKKYRSQSEELSESNSMKEMLLDVIAHDLRNPAGVIKGFAEFGLEMDPKNEILSAIDGGVNNLLDVIHNATTLSKVALGDSIKKEKLDLTDIINIVVKETSSEFEYAEMTLDLKIEEKLIINANPIIGEVFRNYISNAIKYAKPGKRVIIDTIIDNGYVTVNVKDFGETINKKDRDNIFMRNVQLGKTKGRGLGLAIVKRVAEAHNAEVGVKPNKPTGNIFYIKILNS